MKSHDGYKLFSNTGIKFHVYNQNEAPHPNYNEWIMVNLIIKIKTAKH